MTEFYFDMETTGLDFDSDDILTIQWQELDELTGKPLGELNILKSWESSEKEILKIFIPNLEQYWQDFILIGKNLTFEFCFLSRKMERYRLGKFDLHNVHYRAFVDLKPILVMINCGRFTGYDQLIPKTNPIRNYEIPELFKQAKHKQIIKYIQDEADDFIKVYRILKREMPKLKNLLLDSKLLF